mmetsp:Transcript_20127/g.21576  ORF Transcript_20127/g.21576 Transcript_20127/m.21576 type:complete len:124 (-) Transcript_20127:399-770(-)
MCNWYRVEEQFIIKKILNLHPYCTTHIYIHCTPKKKQSEKRLPKRVNGKSIVPTMLWTARHMDVKDDVGNKVHTPYSDPRYFARACGGRHSNRIGSGRGTVRGASVGTNSSRNFSGTLSSSMN